MDTIADPAQELDTSSGECPSSDDLTPEDSEWLEPDESRQIEIALHDRAPKKQLRGYGFRAAAASVAFHAAIIILGAMLFARLDSNAHWRVARGDPTARQGSDTAGSIDSADAALGQQASLAAPAVPRALVSNIHQPPVDAANDSNLLQVKMQLPTPAPADPVIGIGSSSKSPILPHFAASMPAFHSAIASANSGSHDRSITGGGTVPPRVAGPKAGTRGEREGFDSRGLPIPDYPAESRRRGEEGVVLVDVEVRADGSVGSVRVVSDAGYPRLGMAAADKLRTAIFEPARRDGKPVVGHVLIPYRFTLD